MNILKTAKTKRGKMGSSHVNLSPNTQSRLIGTMSNLNLNIFSHD